MNLFLIGITGVGKSVIGKKIARELGMHFIDLDAYIEIKANMSIPDIFKNGEDEFRKFETQALLSIPKDEPHIISTGGGIVVRDENIKFMRENGIVIQLHRNISQILDSINVKRRPMLMENPNVIFDIYESRKELYEKARDLLVDCSNKDLAVRAIIDYIKLRNEVKDEN